MIIWIASYPKSGNTYLRSFIASYYFSKKGKFDFSLLMNILQFPSVKFTKKNIYSETEASQSWIYNQEQFFSGEKVHFVKTHNTLNSFKGNEFVNNNQTLGAIYIVRDPRNVITSPLSPTAKSGTVMANRMINIIPCQNCGIDTPINENAIITLLPGVLGRNPAYRPHGKETNIASKKAAVANSRLAGSRSNRIFPTGSR